MNLFLTRWLMRKYKGLAGHKTRAAEMLKRLAQGQPAGCVRSLVPSPNRLLHRFEGVAADRRGEVHVNPAIFIHGLARPERIAEERELDIGVIPGPIDILAIHDPCLARMQFELAGLEPFPHAIKHVICLPSALAMKHRIVGIPGKPDAGQMPRDPQIKCIVQKQIGQDRRHDTSLRCAFVAFQDLPVRDLHRRFQPAFHVEQDPRLLTVLAQSPHQEVMIEDC